MYVTSCTVILSRKKKENISKTKAIKTRNSLLLELDDLLKQECILQFAEKLPQKKHKSERDHPEWYFG